MQIIYQQNMEVEIKNDDTPKSNENGCTNVTPKTVNLPRGRRSRTRSPCSPSLQSAASRRSINSTPESSSRQRELKKLEDYWTRNNPVTDDSPRLRSNRKATFYLKEYIAESCNVNTFQKEEKKSTELRKVDQDSLPESPIPAPLTRQKIDNIFTADVHEQKGKFPANPSISPYIQECVQKQKQSIAPVSGSTTSFNLSENTLNRNETNDTSKTSKDLPSKNSKNPKVSSVILNSAGAGAVFDTITTDSQDLDSSDSDDDDYIPPRKKLRSEVSKDELWDGIPLTISFKRLAPLQKVQDVTTSSEKSNTRPNSANEYNVITSAKLDLSDTVSFVKLTDFQKCTKKTTSEASDNDLMTPKKVVVPNNNELNNEEQKNTRQRIKRKRSNRLKKNVDNNNSSEGNTSDVKNTTPHEKTYGGEACPRKVDSASEKHLDGDEGGNTLKLTLSQILSVDNESDSNSVVSKEKETCPAEMDKHESDSETDKHTSVASSFSKTLNDIFKEIDGSYSLSDSHSNKTCDEVTHNVENDSKMTRRSRRISQQSSQISADLKTTEAETNEVLNERLDIDENSSHDKESVECCQNTIALSSSKHKMFTKNINKSAKTVPPLRIKLKNPSNVASKKTCAPKQKEKSIHQGQSNSVKTTKSEVESGKKESTQKTDSEIVHDKKVICTDSHVAGTSNDFTSQIKKKKSSRQRKWSPPPTTTISLRLNSERRLSEASNLLSNAVLNKHACVLWSSENRRHVQLSNPHASLSELDAKLSRKWDNLSDKERLKYFQRARDAIKDENRHSTRRSNVVPERNNETDKEKQYMDDCSVENFAKLPTTSQLKQIKKWLSFYNEICPETCSLVISSFKETLAEENKARKEKSKNKKKKKQKDKNATNYNILLYEKIKAHEEKIQDIIKKKKDQETNTVLESYKRLVKRMVAGEIVYFAGEVRSDPLTDTLHELRALERDKKLAVTGSLLSISRSPKSCSDAQRDTKYNTILESLRTWNSPDGKTLVCVLDNEDIDHEELENMCKKIKRCPSLSPNTVENNLPQVRTPKHSDVNLLSPMKIVSKTSPVTVLNDLVAEDLLAKHPQIGFRNAISLLSNKVVPSPTLLLPPKGSNGELSSANRNQNCNIVFTQLQKSRPPVLTTRVNLLN